MKRVLLVSHDLPVWQRKSHHLQGKQNVCTLKGHKQFICHCGLLLAQPVIFQTSCWICTLLRWSNSSSLPGFRTNMWKSKQEVNAILSCSYIILYCTVLRHGSRPAFKTKLSEMTEVSQQQPWSELIVKMLSKEASVQAEETLTFLY